MRKQDVHVLIVDDDESVLESLKQAVNREGFTAIPCLRPADAERAAKVKSIHAILCDSMLPQKNGIDLVIDLKKQLGDDVVIFMFTGIFKNKTYPLDAKNKTGATEFFHKPINIEELLSKLNEQLENLYDAPKVDLHSLSSQPFASNRERRKALDHVEEMYGFDLPFVLSILMDSESTGHLNMASEDHQIFGITFSGGKILNVDTENSSKIMGGLLVNDGYITEDEVSAENENKGDLIKNLIRSGLISPHAIKTIKPKQIVEEIVGMVDGKKLQVNFVPDRKIKEEGLISIEALTYEFDHIVSKIVSDEWLVEFYSEWMEYPIRLGPSYKGDHKIFGFSVFGQSQEIITALRDEPTLEDLLKTNIASESTVYRALHLMAIRRVVVFAEHKKIKNHDTRVKRIRALHKALVGKGIKEVFAYFGAGENPGPEEVIRIYKEFAKSNHPDTLPTTVDSEVRKLNHELFTFVSEAYNILSDPEKRQEHEKSRREAEANQQIVAEDLVADGRKKMLLGAYTDALKIFEEANKKYSNESMKLHHVWALLKTQEKTLDEAKLVEHNELVKTFRQDLGNDPLFHLVSGIIRFHYQDYETAAKNFERAIALDPRFMPARRELAAVESLIDGKSDFTASEILTGDLTTIVGAFFKKKKTK